MRNLCDLVDTNEFIVYCHRINFLVNVVNKNCVCRSHKRVNPHLIANNSNEINKFRMVV